MKSKIKVFFLLLTVVLAACSEDENTKSSGGQGVENKVYYILNSGDWKSNNSSLTMYDAATGNVVQNLFELQNGRKLGNTANDILLYGSKMYIAVAGESTVEVTGLDAKSVKQIQCEAQPRYFAAAGKYVYVTYYNGYVARIDTTDLSVDAKVPVGRNPEQLAIVGNRMYVANSGGMDYNTPLGYDRTVSVIDVNAFEEVNKLDVAVNPAVVVAAEDEVYVASYGNYADAPATLQRIDAQGNVSVVSVCSNMTEFCFLSGTLYGYFSQYDENWTPTITYLSYDIEANTVCSPWINEAELPEPYKINVAAEYLCVTSSDYMNDGDVYMYDTDGMLYAKVPAGLNPVKVIAVE